MFNFNDMKIVEQLTRFPAQQQCASRSSWYKQRLAVPQQLPQLTISVVKLQHSGN